MKLTIVGSGDAFGSGGRLNTCFHVATPERRFLVDCGASALIGLNRQGLDTRGLSTILISHLHGDHYAGLVWLLLEGQHVSRRTEPLTVAGPPGIAERFKAAAEALFPGSTKVAPRFEMRFVEYTIGQRQTIDGLAVTAFEVVHPSGAPSCALRIEADGRTLAYSGDTEWVDSLIPASAGADLFIIECYGYDAEVRYHMSWRRIEAELSRITARRILLTHMNASMLANREAVRHARVALAHDGLELEV